MRPALSQTSLLLLVTIAALAAVFVVIDRIAPPRSPQPLVDAVGGGVDAEPLREPTDETTPWGSMPEGEAGAGARLDAPAAAEAGGAPLASFRVVPHELPWIASLRHAAHFAVIRVPSAAGPLSLTWDVRDLGVAVDAKGVADDEGRHHQSYTLDLVWGDVGAPPVHLKLETSFGFPDAVLSSYCARLGYIFGAAVDEPFPLPELTRFAEGTIRGDRTYRVLATPHAIYVIEQDTSPLDWIPACHDLHQGPFTECAEAQWELAAELIVELPVEVTGTEGGPALDCIGPSETYAAAAGMYEMYGVR